MHTRREPWTLFRALVAGLALAAAASGDVAAAASDITPTDMILGDAKAPVTIIEYASMTCPHCAKFHTETLPKLKKKYIDTGKVRLVFREFPFEPVGLQAAQLARCSGPRRFFGLLDVMFRSQNAWATSPKPEEELAKMLRLAGIDQAGFAACLKDQVVLEQVLQARRDGARDFGVQSTPTFVINGKKVEGALPFAEFEKHVTPHLPKS